MTATRSPSSSRTPFCAGHRAGFRLFWRRRSRPRKTSPLPRETIYLIRDMTARGRLCGAERIRGDSLKLGIKVSKRTIQKFMRGVRRERGRHRRARRRRVCDQRISCRLSVIGVAVAAREWRKLRPDQNITLAVGLSSNRPTCEAISGSAVMRSAIQLPRALRDHIHATWPLALTPGPEATLTAIAPPRWYPECGDDPNACSILLRIDYCQSSVLFTGDADQVEEPDLVLDTPVPLLQVGHHGGNTSSTPALLVQAEPTYAVISSGLPGEGTNATYCHPRAEIVRALTSRIGGAGPGTIRSFPPATSCKTAPPSLQWLDEPASNRLWATSRDGDVVLVTTGDAAFQRE